MRTRFTGGVRIFSDAAEKRALYDPVGSSGNDRVHTGYSKRQSGDFDLTAGQSITVLFGDIVAVKGIEIRATGDVQVALNGAAPFTCSRDIGDTEEDLLLFLRAALTSVVISLPSGVIGTITGRWTIWGDVVTT